MVEGEDAIMEIYELLSLFFHICIYRGLHINICICRSLKRIKWRVATKPTDKEYDRYKGLGAPYARPYSIWKISMNFLNIFGNTRRPCFTPQPNDSSVPVGGLTINSTLSSGLHYLKFSSRLEASQPEMNCRSYSLSQATEKTFWLLIMWAR